MKLTNAQYAMLTGTPAPASPAKRGKGRGRKTVLPLEKEIQASVVAYLRAIGATVIRVNSAAVVMPATANSRERVLHANLTPGCSDLLVCLRGRFLGVEVKRPGGRLTEKQAAFLADVQASGGLGIVVTSVGDLEAKLNAEGLL